MFNVWGFMNKQKNMPYSFKQRVDSSLKALFVEQEYKPNLSAHESQQLKIRRTKFMTVLYSFALPCFQLQSLTWKCIRLFFICLF